LHAVMGPGTSWIREPGSSITNKLLFSYMLNMLGFCCVLIGIY